MLQTQSQPVGVPSNTHTSDAQPSTPHLQLQHTLRTLTDHRGGVKNNAVVPQFLAAVQQENSLKGRLLLIVCVKLSSNSVQRQLLVQGLLGCLVGWLRDAASANKVEFGKVVLGVLGLLPVRSEDVGVGEALQVLQQMKECQGLMKESIKLVDKWSVFKAALKIVDNEEGDEVKQGKNKRVNESEDFEKSKRRKLGVTNKECVKGTSRDMMEIDDQHQMDVDGQDQSKHKQFGKSKEMRTGNKSIATSPLDNIIISLPGEEVSKTPTFSIPKRESVRPMETDAEDNVTQKRATRVSWAPADQLVSVRLFRQTDPAIAVQSDPLPGQDDDVYISEQQFFQNAQKEHHEEYCAQQMKQNMLRQLHLMKSEIKFYTPPLLSLESEFKNWEVCRGEGSTEVSNPDLAPKPRVLYDNIDDIPDTPHSPPETRDAQSMYHPRKTMMIIPFEEITEDAKSIENITVENKSSKNLDVMQQHQHQQNSNNSNIAHDQTNDNIDSTANVSQPVGNCQLWQPKKPLIQNNLTSQSVVSEQTLSPSKQSNIKPIIMLKPCEGYYEIVGSTISLTGEDRQMGYVTKAENTIQPIYFSSKTKLIQPLVCTKLQS
eukprot:TRINITY_DN2222_c1_g3_i1.p1 TRINITY_DN2222_c1_g3~~TRINITY_DN2222_c1_g3_i1.p1  ORF type:complete len:600 (-),score=63.31 TRINITY_DN2222_c1_g3_i1:308-2107(-)